MITSAFITSARAEFFRGVHHEKDTYKCALIKAGHRGTYTRKTSNYAELGDDEVPQGKGYRTGGVVLNGFHVTLDVGKDAAMMDWTNDPEWPKASIAADGALFYNASKGGAALCLLAFPIQPTVSTAGLFTVELPEATPENALIRMDP